MSTIMAMSALTLTERHSPWVVVTAADDPWASAEVVKLQKQGGSVVRLDGRELREPASLFATFARELSFPGYFGHNSDALVDWRSSTRSSRAGRLCATGTATEPKRGN